MPRLFPSAAAVGFSVVITLISSAAPSARAAAYEGFDYPLGTLGENRFGGYGFRDYWRAGTDRTEIVAGSLSDPTGTLLTSGNHVSGEGLFAISRPITERPGDAGGEFWVSFLMRRDTASMGWSGLQIQASDSAGAGFFILEPGGGPGDGSLVISNGSDPIAAVSGVPFQPNRDYFLVARFQLGQGNDPATLWVNPAPGVVPTEGGATFTLGDLGNSSPHLTFHASVPGGVVTHFDELRTGRSYAEVAPVAPEPAGAGWVGALLATFLRRTGRPRRASAA